MKNYTYKSIVASISALTSFSAFAGAPPCDCPKTSGASFATGSLELSLSNNYTFRGQVLDTNPAFVPKVNVQLPISADVSAVLGVEQVVGTRGNGLFRTQYDIGLQFALGKFTFTPGYQVVDFPNQGGTNAQYVTGTLAYNDQGLLPVSLNPSVSVAKDVNPGGGTWYEARVAPEFAAGGVKFSVPVATGWSSNSYYAGAQDNLSYAYATAGLAGEYEVAKNIKLKASVQGYTTDSKLSNRSNNFITTNVGVAVFF